MPCSHCIFGLYTLFLICFFCCCINKVHRKTGDHSGQAKLSFFNKERIKKETCSGAGHLSIHLFCILLPVTNSPVITDPGIPFCPPLTLFPPYSSPDVLHPLTHLFPIPFDRFSIDRLPLVLWHIFFCTLQSIPAFIVSCSPKPPADSWTLILRLPHTWLR